MTDLDRLAITLMFFAILMAVLFQNEHELTIWEGVGIAGAFLAGFVLLVCQIE